MGFIVAVVDGMVFNSSATHAMRLTREALNWCCNCEGGYKKTGCALQIKVANYKFKAHGNLQVQEAPDKKPAAADSKEDLSETESK